MMKNIMSNYKKIRSLTETLCKPLVVEDYVIQSMDDVSPPKWHLAHTTWFFETFILLAKNSTYQEFNPLFRYLFNSYYQGISSPYPRHQRGILARPTVSAVYAYRKYVDEALLHYMQSLSVKQLQDLLPLLEIGLQHEQQHQELLLMDIKHNFFLDAHLPVYQAREITSITFIPMQWINMQGGLVEIGHQGEGFCYDNELARHSVFLLPYQLASRLVTNGEYSEFIAAKGYEHPEWWLAEGWDAAQKNQWQSPLYWQKIENQWHVFTLNGLKELNLNEPVSHVSYYEADAYARWSQSRLPSEAEWEHAASALKNPQGNFLENHLFHPHPVQNNKETQLWGDVWEWTSSAYSAYPGFQPVQGVLSEYNGKFMSNQMVLRGGSCVTPKNHIRTTYRNFFQPQKRWPFSGIRLAKNIK
jgi:ergothioneine biosynthesis protein EgtB